MIHATLTSSPTAETQGGAVEYSSGKKGSCMPSGHRDPTTEAGHQSLQVFEDDARVPGRMGGIASGCFSRALSSPEKSMEGCRPRPL